MYKIVKYNTNKINIKLKLYYCHINFKLTTGEYKINPK
jgi:hypothetical protein